MIISLRKLLQQRPVECALSLIAIAMIAIFGAYTWRFHNLPFGDPSMWGQFGDYVGGMLNPVLGSLSLLALAYTVFLQNKTLEATKEQLRISREESEKSTEAFKSQNEILRIQTFETTLFNMLSNNRAILDIASTDLSRKPTDFGPKMQGHEVLAKIMEMLNHVVNQPSDGASNEKLERAMKVISQDHGSVFDSYARSSQSILKFIATSFKDVHHPGAKEITESGSSTNMLRRLYYGHTELYTLDSKRSFYAEIFASQMTQTEIELILTCAVVSNDAELLESIRDVRFVDHLRTSTGCAVIIRNILNDEA